MKITERRKIERRRHHKLYGIAGGEENKLLISDYTCETIYW